MNLNLIQIIIKIFYIKQVKDGDYNDRFKIWGLFETDEKYS